MKPIVVTLICLGFLAFMGGVVLSTMQAAEVECEVCLEFSGQEVCRMGRGPTEAEARVAAHESTCGGNVSGMAELIACRNQPPVRSTCPPVP